MKKKTNIKSALAMMAFFTVLFLAGSLKVNAKTITMDGSFDDWNDIPLLIRDDIADYPYTGTRYYYNLSANAWQTSAISGTRMYTADRALDVGELKLTNDADYLYILWKRGSDFMNYYWGQKDVINEIGFSNSAAIAYQSNPCEGKVITAPADFNHDMVLSVDKDKNGSYDYYLVINISFAQGSVGDYDTAGYIYKDNGNGTYARSEETLLETFGSNEFELSCSKASVNKAVLQEVKMDIGEIFSSLDLNWGDSVNVRYEAHSDNSDITSAAEYIFEKYLSSSNSDILPKITKVKARKYLSKNGKEKVRVVIYGKNFRKHAKVKLGSKKADKTKRKSSKKIIGYFSMKELKELGHKKLVAKVVDPGGYTDGYRHKIRIGSLKALKFHKYGKIYKNQEYSRVIDLVLNNLNFLRK